jgi:hypothetical protein
LSYFKDVFNTPSRDRLLIGNFLSTLIVSELIPKTYPVPILGEINIADRLNAEMAKASDDKFTRAIDLLADSDLGEEIVLRRRKLGDRSKER